MKKLFLLLIVSILFVTLVIGNSINTFPPSAFNITYNSAGSNLSYINNIPKYSNVTSAAVELENYNYLVSRYISNSFYAITPDTTCGTTYADDGNFDSMGGGAKNGITSYYYLNYTIPNNLNNIIWDTAFGDERSPPGCAWGCLSCERFNSSIPINCFNNTNNMQLLISIHGGWNGYIDDRWYNLSCYDGANWLNVTFYNASDSANLPSLYEDAIYYNQTTSNISIDIGNDGTSDYSNNTLWNGSSVSTTINLNTTTINNYLTNNCSTAYCNLPLNISSASAGILQLSNLNLTYDITGSPNNMSFSNFADNSNSTFPQIGDNIKLNVTVSDLDGIDTCKLMVNDNGSWYNASTYVTTGTNTLVQMNYTIRNTTINNNTKVYWGVWCNDTYGMGVNSINTSNFTVKDITPGNHTNGANNQLINGSVLSPKYNPLLQINTTFYDANLFQASINVSCDINTSLFYWEILDINTSTYNYNTTVNISTLVPQRCHYIKMWSDDHTDTVFSVDSKTEIDNGMQYEARGITTQIISMDNDFDKFDSVKQIDREEFDITFSEKKLKREIKIITDGDVYPREDEYPGHFVIWNKNEKTGLWIDFADKQQNEYVFGIIKTDIKQIQKTYNIERVNDKEYIVTISSVVPQDIQPKKKWFGLTELSTEDTIMEDYGMDKLQLESIGGNNIGNETGDFYIGAAINITGVNVYDNSTICNWTVDVININAYPPWNGTTTIDGCSDEFVNVTNGTYSLRFSHPQYFNQTYSLTVNNNTQNFTWQSYQGVINFIVRTAIDGTVLTGYNVTLNSTNSSNISTQNNVSSSPAVFYLNASHVNYTIYNIGYANYNSSYDLTFKENKTITVDLTYLANMFLYDEFTNQLFNVSDPDSITFYLHCTTAGTYATTITNNTVTLPFNCPYDFFSFFLVYGATSYYRDLIMTQSELNNSKIYLISSISTGVTSNFILDDLLKDYVNPKFYVKKWIENNYVTITSNKVDIENKITAYLIENHEYYLELHSDNKPTFVLGYYAASSSGDRIISPYEISLINPGLVASNSLFMFVGKDPGEQTYYVGAASDKSNKTTLCNYTIYNLTYLGTQLFNSYTLNLSAEPLSSIMFNANTTFINPDNHTIVSEMVCYYDGVPYRTTREDFKEETRIAGDFYNFFGETKVNWFLTILFSVIAIMATVTTASVMVIILALFVMFLLIIKWYTISWVVMGIILLVALIEFMKKGDEQL